MSIILSNFSCSKNYENDKVAFVGANISMSIILSNFSSAQNHGNDKMAFEGANILKIDAV